MNTAILLADEHALVRAGIQRLFEPRPDLMVVGEASNGEEAVRLAAEKAPDIVVIDVCLPHLSGTDAIRRIREAPNAPSCLVLSAQESRCHVQQALAAGASGYVVKSTAMGELLPAIDAVRDGKSYLSPAIASRVVEAVVNPDGADVQLSLLSRRELEVLQLVAEGYSNKELARMLGVSVRTIDSHRAALRSKLKMHHVSQLVRLAIRSGLVTA